MPVSKCKKLSYFVFHFSLCFTELAVIGITAYIIAQIIQFKTFVPTLTFAPAILIIVLNILQFYGFWKGFNGILQNNKQCIILLCAFIVLNSILDVLIGLWSVSVRDSIYESVNSTMHMLFINYTQLHYKKEEWNNIQYQLKCCGVEGPQSFIKVQTDFLPISCCNITTKTVSLCESGIFYKEGCLDLLTSYVHTQLYNFIVIVFTFVVLQIIAIVVFCNLSSVLHEKFSNVHISVPADENKAFV